MKLAQILSQLKKAGTAQNRKVYRRHGVVGALDGVSYANLGKLQKRIGRDPEIARQLWETGNHDARVLATMVADPAVVKSSELELQAKDLDNYILADALAKLTSQTPWAEKKAARWTRARGEWASSAGWQLLSHIALDKKPKASDYFTAYLERIATTIDQQPNRTRHSMNNALIAIGLCNSTWEKKALAVARKIGVVEVDHGQTSCQTPDAAAYIARVQKRKKARG